VIYVCADGVISGLGQALNSAAYEARIRHCERLFMRQQPPLRWGTIVHALDIFMDVLKILTGHIFSKKYYLRDDCPSCVDVCQSTFEYRRGGGHSQHDGCQDSQLVVHVPALIHIPSLEGHLLYDDIQNLRLMI